VGAIITLPNERLRAVLNTREFLLRLASPYTPGGFKRIPLEVRRQARWLLKHFPGNYDMNKVAQALPDSFEMADEQQE